MAQSKSFFGLRRGSTKTLTFQVNNGKQITKDRVTDVKNPRTSAQMRQRMLMTTVMAAYSYMKAIADHSFEGYTNGQQCMGRFESVNLAKFKTLAQDDSANIAFNEYKDTDINPLDFILAQGSLPAFAPEFDNYKLRLAFDATDVTTAEAIYSAMGINSGDLVTFCTVRGTGDFHDNNIYTYTADSFDIVRLYASQSGAVADPAKAFVIESNAKDLTVNVSFEDGKLLLTSSKEVDFGTVILSRKASDKWLRSNAVMIVDEGVAENCTVGNQFSSYPIGSELILNNGEMSNVADNGADATTPVEGVTPKSVSIEVGNDYQLTIKNPNSQTVVVTSSAPSVATISANGLIHGVAEGSAVLTIKLGSNSYTVNVAVSGQPVAEGIGETSCSVAVGGTHYLAVNNPNNAAVTVTAQNSNASAAFQASNSRVLITGVTAGADNVNVTIGSNTYTCVVTITEDGGDLG